MSESKKTWVIGITDDLEIMESNEEPITPTRIKVKPLVRPLMKRQVTRAQPRPVVKPVPRRPMHYALLVMLTYLLGPFALLLTGRGRQNRTWLFTGCSSGLVGLGLMVGRGSIMAGIESGLAIVMLGLLTVLVVMAGFSAWARALVLTKDPDPAVRAMQHQAFPSWLHKPWVLGSLGFLAPGLGLLLAGRARRAAAVLWACQLGVLAGLVVLHARWIWQVNVSSDIGALDPNRLEVIFMGAALACLLSGMGWVGLALEGGRQAASAHGGSRLPRGDWYSLALVASLAVFAFTADPVMVAEGLDAQGQRLQELGYRVIPLTMSVAAHRCDPSRARYAIQAVDLYAELGHGDKAEELRSRLDQNLGDFVELVLLEESPPGESSEILYAETGPGSDQLMDQAMSPLLQQAMDQNMGPVMAEDSTPAPVEIEDKQPEQVFNGLFPHTFFGAMLVPDPE
ncbi:MAG: hypothetical protein KOO60_11875 [Gemmatimonadales bacterium]|nr:hypothetical protein [Gemmatimonadales bacterium]